MKKKLLKLFCFVVLSAFASAASLRDAVCIVRSVPSEKTTSFLKNYSSSLKSQGFSKYAAGIDEYLKGSFGSGFVYDASNGKKYVITNRHVVDSADTVILQFEKDDGTYDEYADLKILAVDDDLDVAVIELQSTLRKTAIPVKTSSANDGDDVWTAGFPALAGKPAWQFGKGAVTNATARIEELVPVDVSSLIQHSAQVDAGNSGGPLLVKDSSSAYGYAVVGINTWKAYRRENTNFAIPMKTVKTFVENAVAKKNSSSKLDSRLARFNTSIANKEETFGRMSSYISNDMISSLSSNTFLKIIDAASKDSQEVIVETFLVDPLEGIRFALSSYIYNCFRSKGELLTYTTSEPVAEGNAYNITFTVNEKTSYDSKWIQEQGMWKLADFNGLVSNDGASISSGITISNPFTMDIYGSVYYPFDKGLDFSVGFTSYVEDILGVGFHYSSDTFGPYQCHSANAKAKLQIPVNFGNIILTPYGFAGYGVYFLKGGSEFDFSFGYQYGGGLELLYDAGTVGPYVGVQYIGKTYKPDPFEDLKYLKNGVELIIGLKFGKNAGLKLW